MLIKKQRVQLQLYQERQDLESDERWRGADESEEAHRGDYGEQDQSHSEKTEEDQVWSQTQFYSIDFSKSRVGEKKCPQVNHSVLNDIEQYRRNRWYSNIVHIMRNHSGLTKTFLD